MSSMVLVLAQKQLTPEQEEALVSYLLYMADHNYPLTLTMVKAYGRVNPAAYPLTRHPMISDLKHHNHPLLAP